MLICKNTLENFKNILKAQCNFLKHFCVLILYWKKHKCQKKVNKLYFIKITLYFKGHHENEDNPQNGRKYLQITSDKGFYQAYMKNTYKLIIKRQTNF